MKKNTALTLLISVLAVNLSGCGTLWKTTEPRRTALSQVLVSTAAERAATALTTDNNGQVQSNLASGLGKSFVDAKNFKNSDELYALQAIRDSFLAAGIVLVDDVKKADTIIEVATGALSIDNTSSLVGIPAMALPVPLAGNVQIPEVALYKTTNDRGLAKFSISLRDAHTGKVRIKPFTAVGTAFSKSWEVLLFFKFMENDLQLPQQYDALVH